MKPTEHEMTAATDAAARAYYAESTRAAGEPRREFDDLGAMDRWRLRQMVMPLAVAAVEAIPDRRADAWDEGRDTAPDATNPYREDPT